MGSNNPVRGGYWLDGTVLQAPEIDSSLFTHLFCSFAELRSNPNYHLFLSPQCMHFPQIVRRRNPRVITLLSIGGGSAGSTVFSNMASQLASRQAFIASSIAAARSYGYDGLDLDWEGQTLDSEMANLATLLYEWRKAVNQESLTTGRPRLILTAAVSVFPRMYQRPMFPIAAIKDNLDWVNVMAYDMYAPGWSPSLTRAPAALHDPTNQISGRIGIDKWIAAGVPAGQLVLGFPFYGYAWKLKDANRHGISAPANGIDTSGIANPDGGWVSYRDLMQHLVIQRGGTVEYDPMYVTNYCYAGLTWVGYDDKKTIITKVQYAKANLRGYFAWHLGHDDANQTLSRQASAAWGPQ